MQHFRGGMDHWILQAPADLPQQGRLSCLTMLGLRVRAAKRLAQPDDVGRVVASSDEARWITGDTIRVDGRSKL
jgi:NAD(P)-dependent dehydrogenase (short-subunit alcohol dehydrogenase family)